MIRITAIRLSMVALVIAAVAVGCQSSGTKEEPRFTVTGKVVRDGQPLPLDPKLADALAAYVRVTFIRLTDEQGTGSDFSESTNAKPDGTFEIQLPKGKYRIAVDYEPGDGTRPLGDKFGEYNSPIIEEITGEQQIEIDLAKY